MPKPPVPLPTKMVKVSGLHEGFFVDQDVEVLAVSPAAIAAFRCLVKSARSDAVPRRGWEQERQRCRDGCRKAYCRLAGSITRTRDRNSDSV